MTQQDIDLQAEDEKMHKGIMVRTKATQKKGVTNTVDYAFEMDFKGVGFLNYFTDWSWLFGWSSYNIINLDAENAMIVHGCDSYFWIVHYNYFWIMNRKPAMSSIQ